MKKLNVKLPQGGSKRALHSGMYASVLAVVVLAVGILAAVKIRTKRKTGSWRGRRNDP
mgnify:CR=1 FL=1